MGDILDWAVRLYEDGFVLDAARILWREREAAMQRGDSERTAEIDELATSMRGHFARAEHADRTRERMEAAFGELLR